MCLENEPVWSNEIAFQPLTDALDARFEQGDPRKSNKLSEEETRAGISSPLRQISLSAQDIGSLKQARPKVTSNDFVQGKISFYTTLEGFSASKKMYSAAKKAKFPVLIHLLDNLIIHHTCCEMHENVVVEFITVQEAEEDENGNDLTTAKPEVAVILRAKQLI